MSGHDRESVPKADALLTPEQLRAELRKSQRSLRGAREKTLTDAIDALERESNGLHVRDAGLDDGIQRSIRVLWDMKRRAL